MKTNTYDEMQMQPTGRTITLQLFELHELGEEAQERAYNDFLESIWSYDVQDELYNTIDYYARKVLDHVGACWDCDSYGNLWPEMRKIEMPQTGEADRMPLDIGDYNSNDMAQAFNAHGPKMQEYASMWYQVAFPEYGSAFYECSDETSYSLLDAYESLYLDEYEQALTDALRVWVENREEEEKYLTSREAFEDEAAQGYECRTIDRSGRVYYSDCRKWYTIDGELYEQSNINHECVSIVKR